MADQTSEWFNEGHDGGTGPYTIESYEPGSSVILTRFDVIAILDRYLASQLTAEDLTDWADLIECREDIDDPELEHKQLVEVVFRLANPNLRGDITPTVAVASRHELAQS